MNRPIHRALAVGPLRAFEAVARRASFSAAADERHLTQPRMKVVAVIEPPQADVIEEILRHCGMWHASSPRAPPAGDLHVHDPGGDSAASDECRELTYVDIDTFEATS